MGQDASSPPRFVEELDESAKKEKRHHRGGREQLKATGKRSRRYTWWNGNDDGSPGKRDSKITNKEDDDLMLKEIKTKEDEEIDETMKTRTTCFSGIEIEPSVVAEKTRVYHNSFFITTRSLWAKLFVQLTITTFSEFSFVECRCCSSSFPCA